MWQDRREAYTQNKEDADHLRDRLDQVTDSKMTQTGKALLDLWEASARPRLYEAVSDTRRALFNAHLAPDDYIDSERSKRMDQWKAAKSELDKVRKDRKTMQHSLKDTLAKYNLTTDYTDFSKVQSVIAQLLPQSSGAPSEPDSNAATSDAKDHKEPAKSALTEGGFTVVERPKPTRSANFSRRGGYQGGSRK